MVINHTSKWVFVHNPKVAGTSIRKVLLPYNQSSMELWHQRFIPELQRIVDVSHLSAEEFDAVCPDVGRDYFRFGFVRDPYARLYSALKEYSKQHSVDVHSTSEKRGEFILNTLTPCGIQYDWSLSHFRPQFMFFYRGRKRVVDFIGRFHDLNNDFRSVMSLLNVSVPDKDLTVERDTGATLLIEDPSSFFGEEALKWVNRLYGMDWLLFAPYLQTNMVGGLDYGSHFSNVENIRSPLGRKTFYGEPPGLSLGEKVGFLTAEVERLRSQINQQSYNPT